MGEHVRSVLVRATPSATQVGVLAAIDRWWSGRGGHPDPRNPLRLPPSSRARAGRVGAAVSEPRDGWLAVVASDDGLLGTRFARDLARELATTTGLCLLEDTVNRRSLRWFGDDGAEPEIAPAELLEVAQRRFPLGLSRFGAILGDRALRPAFRAIGHRLDERPGPPEQAIWSPLERGDGEALATAVRGTTLAVAVAALERVDLGDPAERRAIAAVDPAGLPPPLLAAIAGAAAAFGDEDLLAAILASAPRTAELARTVVDRVGLDHERALALIDRLAASAPEDLLTRAVGHLRGVERLDPAQAAAWSDRTRAVCEARPELDHMWIGIWARLGDLERAADHAVRAVAGGYPLDRLRGKAGGVADPLHVALTAVPRYRALFRTTAAPAGDADGLTGATARVTHAKFGAGTTLRDLAGDKVEVQFDDGATRILQRRFLRPA